MMREKSDFSLKSALIAGVFFALIIASVTVMLVTKPGELSGVTDDGTDAIGDVSAIVASLESEIVVVPGGSFMMGASSNVDDKTSDALPRHEVHLPAFAVAKYPVTRQQFSAFIKDSGYHFKGACDWRKPGYPQAPDHPVMCMDWHDADEFVSWLSKKTGHSYRLLSEAEYEYAERAGTDAQYSWGDDFSQHCPYANLDSKGTACKNAFPFSSPVGSLKPNRFGLYDMSGNAWSWVADCYHPSYDGAPTDGSPWISGKCSSRILRGGAWGSTADIARVEFRNAIPAYWGMPYFGFRIARSLQ